MSHRKYANAQYIYNLMKFSVANPQFNVKSIINGYSPYVHIKYHTVFIKVILHGGLCNNKYCSKSAMEIPEQYLKSVQS